MEGHYLILGVPIKSRTTTCVVQRELCSKISHRTDCERYECIILLKLAVECFVTDFRGGVCVE